MLLLVSSRIAICTSGFLIRRSDWAESSAAAVSEALTSASAVNKLTRYKFVFIQMRGGSVVVDFVNGVIEHELNILAEREIGQGAGFLRGEGEVFR